MSRDELADRYLMTMTLQQVVEEITQALRLLTERGYVVAETPDATGGPLFRVSPEHREAVRGLLGAGDCASSAGAIQAAPIAQSRTGEATGSPARE